MGKPKSYADITPQMPEWLIRNFVQLAGVTYVLGEGGVGKTFLTASWVACVTNGWPMPGDGQDPLPPGSAILVNAEDSPAFSLSWRLGAAGANMARVYDMTEGFKLPDGLNTVRDAMTDIGDVRLMIIDPLAGASSIPITSGNVRIRDRLSLPLEHFAAETGAAVVVIHHTTKAGRMAGSAAIQQAARNVVRVSRSPSDDRIRLIAIEKTNVADEHSGALAYTLAGEGLATRVEYLSVPDGPALAAPELSVPDKVLAALRGSPEPLQKSALPGMVGADYGTVGVALTRLKDAGMVTSPKRGWWTVPDREEADAGSRELELVTA